MIKKYFKPTSLTWLSFFVPLACGLFMAFEPVHGLSQLVLSTENMTNMTAAQLINVGLAGIGIRGAIG